MPMSVGRWPQKTFEVINLTAEAYTDLPESVRLSKHPLNKL